MNELMEQCTLQTPIVIESQTFRYANYLKRKFPIPTDYKLEDFNTSVNKIRRLLSQTYNLTDARQILKHRLCSPDLAWNTRKATMVKYLDTGIPVFTGVSREIDPISDIIRLLTTCVENQANSFYTTLSNCDKFTVAVVSARYTTTQLNAYRNENAQSLINTCRVCGPYSDSMRRRMTADFIDNMNPIPLTDCFSSQAVIEARDFFFEHQLLLPA